MKDNLNKAPVESLLSICGSVTELACGCTVYLPDACSPDTHYNPDKLCAIRYLASFLELPKFWRLETDEGIYVGKEFFGFLSRLSETIFQLIRDIEPSGTDDAYNNLADDLSPLWTSARHAVDILAFATFRGFLELPGNQDHEPPSSSSLSPLQSLVSLLTRYVLFGWKFFVCYVLSNSRRQIRNGGEFPKCLRSCSSSQKKIGIFFII